MLGMNKTYTLLRSVLTSWSLRPIVYLLDGWTVYIYTWSKFCMLISTRHLLTSKPNDQPEHYFPTRPASLDMRARLECETKNHKNHDAATPYTGSWKTIIPKSNRTGFAPLLSQLSSLQFLVFSIMIALSILSKKY